MSLSRKANSLMTVYEQSSINETGVGDSSSKPETWRSRSPSSVSDLTYKRTTTATNVPLLERTTTNQETVKNENDMKF